MASYKYSARNSSGQVSTGVVAADSVTTAATMLRNQGLHVLSLSGAAGGAKPGSFAARFAELNAGSVSQSHVLDFTSQLAVMVRAGINLRAALEGIGDQTSHPGFKKIILQLKEDVEGGKQFSEALSKHPKLFNPLYINMVRASEMSGSFSKMLDRIGGYIGQQLETRKMVIGAAIYPAIIGTMAVGVTVFLLAFVLPRFYTVFEGKEDVLPWATKFLMGLSKFVTAQWYWLVGGVALIGGAGYAILKTEVGAFWADKLKLMLPVVRNMFRALYISRSLQTFGQLINAGVPMLDTLRITGEISGNQMYKGMWMRVHNAVKTGKKLQSVLTKDPLLPKSVSQMIAAGEESGKLGEVLDEVSTYYAKQLKDAIKAVTAMIEPIMIILMGTVVGFIAMAIILPIFKMSSLVK